MKGKALPRGRGALPTSRPRILGGVDEEAQGRVEELWRAGVLAPPLSPDKGGRELFKRTSPKGAKNRHRSRIAFRLLQEPDPGVTQGCVHDPHAELEEPPGNHHEYDDLERIHTEERDGEPDSRIDELPPEI